MVMEVSMHELTPQHLQWVEGGDIWSAIACGSTLALAASQGFLNPITDMAVLAACGYTLTD